MNTLHQDILKPRFVAHLEHDRREFDRRKLDRTNDKFRGIFFLTIAAVFVLGILAGVQMEKRNAENIRSVTSVSSAVIPSKEAK